MMGVTGGQRAVLERMVREGLSEETNESGGVKWICGESILSRENSI